MFKTAFNGQGVVISHCVLLDQDKSDSNNNKMPFNLLDPFTESLQTIHEDAELVIDTHSEHEPIDVVKLENEDKPSEVDDKRKDVDNMEKVLLFVIFCKYRSKTKNCANGLTGLI